MNHTRKLTVFYDGDCGFCERSVAIVRAFDWLGLFRYATLQGSQARLVGIPAESYPSEMILHKQIPSGGRRWGGWSAVKQIWFRMPALYLALAAAWFLHPALFAGLTLSLTPLANPLGNRLYRWIARNRQRFPASTCRVENP